MDARSAKDVKQRESKDICMGLYLSSVMWSLEKLNGWVDRY
jgi:hypothetical protein